MKDIGNQDKRSKSENRVKKCLPEWISNLSPELSIRNLPPNGVPQFKTLIMIDREGSNYCVLALLQEDGIDKFLTGVASDTSKKIGGEKHSGSPHSRRQF